MFDDLREAVGRGMPNRKADVELVQRWLRTWDKRFHPGASGLSEGHLDGFIEMAIARFQRETMKQRMPSEVVRPGDATAKRMASTPGPRPEGRVLSLPPRSDYRPLSEEDYQKAADVLGCEARAIKAVGKIEGLNGGGFDHFNRPVILFEPLHFNKNSFRAFERSNPELTRKHNGRFGSYEEQWTKLRAAYKLNSKAALFATSWGRFQILGEYFQDAGFSLVEIFVYAMCDSEKKQLEAFTFYSKANPRRLHGLRNKDWTEFARYYNGVNYFKSNYDGRIEAAYEDLGR